MTYRMTLKGEEKAADRLESSAHESQSSDEVPGIVTCLLRIPALELEKLTAWKCQLAQT